MKRRDFGKIGLLASAGALSGCKVSIEKELGGFSTDGKFYHEPEQKLH